MKWCRFPNYDQGAACPDCDFLIPSAGYEHIRVPCGLIKQTERERRAARGKPQPAPETNPVRDQAEQLRILAICHACEHCHDPELGVNAHCQVLIDRGGAGRLMHPRGIPSPRSRCPLPEPKFVESLQPRGDD